MKRRSVNPAPKSVQTLVGVPVSTGSSKFLIHRIDIEEPAAPAAPGRWGQSPQPAADPKPIVSAWNPDESWDDDPAVRCTSCTWSHLIPTCQL